MSGKDIYEEVKRLRVENDLLRAKMEQRRLHDEVADDALADLAREAFAAVLLGKAFLWVQNVGKGGMTVTLVKDAPTPPADAP